MQGIYKKCASTSIESLSLSLSLPLSQTMSNKPSSYIISNNLQFCERPGVKTLERNNSLPFMYGISKLHYFLSQARFSLHVYLRNAPLIQSSKFCRNYSKRFLIKSATFTRKAAFTKITIGFG